MQESTNTKRIAKNTLMLYLRQILVMLVSLYTVREVLNALGAEDYGIYNVVAGIVVFFTFVNYAMASGTQRFLNFFLGKGDKKKLQEVYSASLLLHLAIVTLFIVLAETVGLWFIITKLNIPSERHFAAVWTYQLAVLTTVWGIMRIPYHSVVIAYEKMSFFAQLSVMEAILKFGIALLLRIGRWDKLIFYSVLLCLVSFIMLIAYKLYCNKYFDIAHFVQPQRRQLVGEIASFSGWSLLGGVANVSCTQGTNVVLNMFTNVSLNAAMGIANQVNSAVYGFVGNFQTAFNPQIVKSYADGEKDYFIKLICQTAKLSFFLLLFMVVPLYINADFVLNIWLKNVPEYSVAFVRLILIWSLIDSLNGPLWMSIQATGDIRNYQIIVSILIFANLPLSILAFYFGANPLWILYIRIGLNIVITFWRVFFLRKRIDLPAMQFIFDIIIKCTLVALSSFFISYLCSTFFAGIKGFFITCIVSVVFNLFFILLLGMRASERALFFSAISSFFKNIFYFIVEK